MDSSQQADVLSIIFCLKYPLWLSPRCKYALKPRIPKIIDVCVDGVDHDE